MLLFLRRTLAVGLVTSGTLAAQTPGELFPEPFLVEHQIVQTDERGDVFAGEPVVDYYGGSWIVSKRADGSRIVIDLARREITEIRPDEGVYYALSFDRFTDLRSEIARFEAGFPTVKEEPTASIEKAAEPEFEVTATPGGALKARSAGLPRAANDMLTNPGVQHLRVSLKGNTLKSTDDESMDVWCDTSVKLTPNAMAALERFELDVLGPPAWLKSTRVVPARFLAAARRQTAGAFPIRTVRPLDLGVSGPEKNGGIVEDVTLRLEKLDSFPLEMVAVPDGLRRTAHPMEAMAAFAEREEERERIMGQANSDE